MHVVAHVGEDGGEDAALLELKLPRQHGGVLSGPHAAVPQVQLLRGAGGEIEARIAKKLLPEGEAGQLAFVIGVAVGPVERLEALQRQPGDAQQRGVGFGVLWTGEYHSIVEDNRAQCQCFSLEASVYGGKGCCFYCA